jgi:uncharacterized protein with ParB-like and HNH nuclease domain
MQSKPLSIYDLFDHKRRYVVPLFQRQYVWSRDIQWEPLWEDISAKATHRLEHASDDKVAPHFLGAMVLNQMQTFGNAVPSYTIIDGQQRLTTFQIFLAAFRDVARLCDSERFASEIERYIFNTGLMEKQEVERFKVFPTRADQEQFRDVMTAGTRLQLEEKYPAVYIRRKLQARPRMVEAYLYFTDAIDEYLKEHDSEGTEGIEALYQALRRDLLLVSIELESNDDPQLIFETLNARGEPLLASDLLRNSLFRRAEQNLEDQNNLYDEYWVKFESDFWRKEMKQGRLTRARIDIFMQHFLALKTGKDTNVLHLFKEYKDWIKEKSPYATVEAELVDLLRYAGTFCKLVNPDVSTRFGSFAQTLELLDVRTIYPLALFLLTDSELAQAELDGITDDLESYLVRRTVCGKTTKNYNKMFLQILRDLQEKGTSRKRVQESLLSYTGDAGVFPADDEFKRAWLTAPVYEKIKRGRVEAILRAIEQEMHGRFSEAVTINTSLTVEHVMPQSWEENWPIDAEAMKSVLGLFVEGTSAEFTRDIMIQTFGNLTLLTQPLNTAVSNSAYEIKRPRIAEQSLLQLNSYFQTASQWSESTIRLRGERLFEYAQRLWPYPEFAA